MPVRQHFVRCLNLVQYRPPHLRKRTYLGTIGMTANQWTSQPHCSRRCCLIRKVYSMDRERTRCHCDIPSIYFTGFDFLSVFCLSLCCSPLMCCRCMHVLYPCLCCYCHCVSLMLFMLSDCFHGICIRKSGTISLMTVDCCLSGNRSCSLANASLQLGCRHGGALRGQDGNNAWASSTRQRGFGFSGTLRSTSDCISWEVEGGNGIIYEPVGDGIR